MELGHWVTGSMGHSISGVNWASQDWRSLSLQLSRLLRALLALYSAAAAVQ